MSKKSKAAQEKALSLDWMTPIDESKPCGADLEYDPEFVVLFAQVAAKMDAQYGDFVGTAEPINWSEIERDCCRLMMRSKDIRLAVLFTRCRTRLGGAVGLAEGLALLDAWLTAFADAVHPQPDIDDDRDASLEIRMNALQALTVTDGLLSDVREIALKRSSVAPLRVRDVERAFAQPRPNDALSVESVTQQLQELRAQQPDVLAGFDNALSSLDTIDAWNQTQLGAFSADLSALARTLKRLAGDGAAPVPPALRNSAPRVEESEPSTIANVDDPQNESTTSVFANESLKVLVDREGALRSIREARHWFETHEPSSPIPLLLKRAEQFVGKRFSEVVKAIPADLLAEWDKTA